MSKDSQYRKHIRKLYISAFFLAVYFAVSIYCGEFARAVFTYIAGMLFISPMVFFFIVIACADPYPVVDDETGIEEKRSEAILDFIVCMFFLSSLIIGTVGTLLIMALE